MKSIIKTLVLALLCATILNCISNNNPNNIDPLIGEWLRSDSSDSFKYKLVFTSYNDKNLNKKYGLLINENIFDDGKKTSSAKNFHWEVIRDSLTMVFDDNSITKTTYKLNEQNKLLLIDFSKLAFTKISEGEQY